MTNKPKPTPGPYSVQRYIVNSRGEEVGSLAQGPITERLRIVAVDDDGAGPILADMVVGGRATAELMAAAPRMRAAILEVATLLDAWAEGERRAYCSTIDERRKQRATVLMESYTLAARTLRDALPKEALKAEVKSLREYREEPCQRGCDAELARLRAEVAELLEALRAEDAARLAANDYPPGDSLGMDRAMRARTHADTLRRAAIAKAGGR